jgi:thiamine-monophosphate kinase
MAKKRNEFELIDTYFAPLSKNFKGALNLKDDAALLSKNRVLSTDGFAEGVHFRFYDSAYSVGEKVLRASLSDLAAMGATPECWFLTAGFGDRLSGQIKNFALGCQRAQERFGITLAGGDMVRVAGNSFFSVTVIGKAKKSVQRNGGKPKDRLYITGTLGDAALGLVNPQDEFLSLRYLYPEPRLAFGASLPKLARAAIDLSDGLVADLTHLCKASGCGAIIYEDRLPISHSALRAHPSPHFFALNAGDDYELLVAASPRKEKKLFRAAVKTKTPLTCIGELTRRKKIVITNGAGINITPPKKGYNHFPT